MYRFALLVLCLWLVLPLHAQQVTGVIADAETGQGLPFATVKQGGLQQGIITDIKGRFSFRLPEGVSELHISYVGYKPLTITVQRKTDSIFLDPIHNTIGEIIIKPPYDKIRRIINTAVHNKPQNNPDQYDGYSCNIYYKMKGDFVPNKHTFDDTARYSKTKFDKFASLSHVFLSETYSRKTYQHPQQVQEVVLASRFSGLDKTYFTNLVTAVLPFHVYTNYIKLIGKDFNNPIADGWQARYTFDLLDEVLDGTDTIFILKYKPKKGAVFNALQGTVYINSNGFAITHIIASSSDTANHRDVKMEQIYQHVNGKWFPRELNYDFTFHKYPTPKMGLRLTGHSVVDSVSFERAQYAHIDKAHAVKLDDSVDTRKSSDWDRFRTDTLSNKEKNTYTVIDSISKKNHVEDVLRISSRLFVDGLQIGLVSFDLDRFIALNPYESVRLGAGLHTNDKLSRYFSLGGWGGYGFKDKIWKYGGFLKIFPRGDKDSWLRLAYARDYQTPGLVRINDDIDKNAINRWVLQKVNTINEFTATAHTHAGYWEPELEFKKQYLDTLAGKATNHVFDVSELSLRLRYAYGERRAPVFGYYYPISTKYPIAYLDVGAGTITAPGYDATYYKALAAVTYEVHINRWGKENFQLSAGMVTTKNNKPLPNSFLLAASGYRSGQSGYQIYSFGGFMTMLPFAYYNDRYVSLNYRHDFDKCFYESKFSRPFLSIAHNVILGGLKHEHEIANPGLMGNTRTYNETGMLLNHILRFNYFNLAWIGVNVGTFYYWAPKYNWKANTRNVIGISFQF